ncbi:MAG: hypothetical protein CMH57_15780 [Myxococcales bacterium]|nr:hypothetical protein [Myxococcales bacterium]
MRDTNPAIAHLALTSLLACALLGGLACEPLEALYGDTCSLGEGTAVLEGEWVISGEGTREGCLDEDLNGSFKLGPSIALRVEQSGANNDKITLLTPVSGFALDGQINGSCVDISTEEDWKGGIILRHYSGVVTPGGNIEGTFSGSGPASCQVDGTFVIEVN